jgi:hypothetical protein
MVASECCIHTDSEALTAQQAHVRISAPGVPGELDGVSYTAYYVFEVVCSGHELIKRCLTALKNFRQPIMLRGDIKAYEPGKLVLLEWPDSGGDFCEVLGVVENG